jgi:hypothetical protein
MRRQAASGLSAPRFCARERLSLATFYLWRRRLQVGDRSPSIVRPPKSPTASPTSTSALVPVRLVADALSPRCLEVQWPSGVVLRVPSGSDEATVRMVIQAVFADGAEQASC